MPFFDPIIFKEDSQLKLVYKVVVAADAEPGYYSWDDVRNIFDTNFKTVGFPYFKSDWIDVFKISSRKS
jgi:hypothetical protein